MIDWTNVLVWCLLVPAICLGSWAIVVLAAVGKL